MPKLISKLPSSQEAVSVSSVIVFLVFSWTLYRMFWYIPSWLEYLNIGNVLITASYILSFALFESGVILGLLFFLSLLLPGRLFKDEFIAQGSTLVTVLSFGAFLLQRKMKLIYRLSFTELLIYPVIILVTIVVLIIVLAYLFKRFRFITRFICAVAESMTIFLFLYVPLGILGMLMVLYRNLP